MVLLNTMIHSNAFVLALQDGHPEDPGQLLDHQHRDVHQGEASVDGQRHYHVRTV